MLDRRSLAALSSVSQLARSQLYIVHDVSIKRGPIEFFIFYRFVRGHNLVHRIKKLQIVFPTQTLVSAPKFRKFSKRLPAWRFSPSMSTACTQHPATLEAILQFTRKQACKKRTYRLFSTGRTANEIATFKEKLNQSLDLFQINELLALDLSAARISRIVSQNNDILKRIDVRVSTARQSSETRDSDVHNLIVRREDLVFKEEILMPDGKEYHISSAKMRRDGSAVIVKIFHCRKTRAEWDAIISLRSRFMHSNFLQLVGYSPAESLPSPFIVYDGQCETRVELLIARALRTDLDLCVKTWLESGSWTLGANCPCLLNKVYSSENRNAHTNFSLDYLTFNPCNFHQGFFSVENFDVLCTTEGKVLIGLDLSRLGADTNDKDGEKSTISTTEVVTELAWNVFQALTCKTLNDANAIAFDGLERDRDHLPSAIQNLSLASEPSGQNGIKWHGPVEPSMSYPSALDTTQSVQRELYWHSTGNTDLSLLEISKQYDNTIKMSTVVNPPLRKVRGRDSGKRHRCPGFLRETIALNPNILETAVIFDTEPELGEICPICLARVNKFDCICGRESGRDEPMITCTYCDRMQHQSCAKSIYQHLNNYVCHRCNPFAMFKIAPRGTKRHHQSPPSAATYRASLADSRRQLPSIRSLGVGTRDKKKSQDASPYPRSTTHSRTPPQASTQDPIPGLSFAYGAPRADPPLRGEENGFPSHITSAKTGPPFALPAGATEWSGIIEPLVMKKRKRANATQLKILQETFARTAFPSTEERAELAKKLDMTPRGVQIWWVY
ncbi:hypothetical protein EW146_g1856 [Bondarzewia mesenterica]|uniref:Homeobox domain-containing protein n=1 Tax=Bondarzewia mesenterica TaxID=1095465 RepID=A0A4S4M8S1_9AGAM|nr:hypothetical protein EW146_g1856 [Bondarzewia mesenterica]